MSSFVIPQSKIESLRGSAGDFVWSEGAYEATFEKFEARDLPSSQNGEPWAGYETTDGTRLSIQLASLTPLEEGMKDPGNRKFFLDLVIGDGEHTITNVDVAAENVPYWQLQKSARLIGNLALAMGEIDFDGDNVVVKETFLDDLLNGQFTGQRIGFVLFNRKAKNGNLYPEIETFVGA